MKAPLLILILFCFKSVSAQFVLSHTNFDIYEYTDELSKIAKENENLNSKIKGSPYIYDEFLPIKFASFGDKLYDGRFNAYDGTIEVIPSKGEKPIALTKNNKDLEFTFVTLNKTYRTYTYFDNDDNEMKTDFFVNVLILENVSLLKKEQIKLNTEVKAKDPFHMYKPSEFKRLEDTYFLKIKNNDLILLPNKKKLINLFPNHKEKISLFLKNKKLKLKDEADLKTLISFLNQLD